PCTRRFSKALEMAPLAVFASTSASAGAGRRIAISPETLVRPMSVGPWGSRSTIIEPLTESARTEGPEPSTTVRSPETELNRRSPVTAWASRLPETVSARTGPESETRVVSPVTPFTAAGPRMPETTAEAPTTPTSIRVCAGTARETTAWRRRPLRSSSFRKPFQGRSSYATVRVPPCWVTTRGGPSISETWSRAEPSSVPTTFTVPFTMRTWSSLTGSSKVSFAGSVTDHSDMWGLLYTRHIASYVIHDISRPGDCQDTLSGDGPMARWPDGSTARPLDRSTARPLDSSDGSGGGGGSYGARPTAWLGKLGARGRRGQGAGTEGRVQGAAARERTPGPGSVRVGQGTRGPSTGAALGGAASTGARRAMRRRAPWWYQAGPGPRRLLVVLVVQPGQPGGQALHRDLEVGVQVDEGPQLLREPLE